MHKHICPQCEKTYEHAKKTRKFCSHSCSSTWHFSHSRKKMTPDEIRESRRIRARNYARKRNKNPEWKKYKLKMTNKSNKEVRLAVIMAYGGLACSCDHSGNPCGPKPIEFLCLDHIGGNGKEKGSGGYSLYRKLRKLHYPPGYRILCHNCNSSLGFYGRCPMSDTEIQQRWKTSPGNKKVRAHSPLL